jgi:transcriptional regulator EpsA
MRLQDIGAGTGDAGPEVAAGASGHHAGGGVPPPDAAARHLESIGLLVIGATQVHRRHQFFQWSQGALQALLPHDAIVCGAFDIRNRGLAFDVFNRVVVSPPCLQSMTDAGGPWLRTIVAGWVEGDARPRAFDLKRFPEPAAEAATALHRETSLDTLLVHGWARPGRVGLLESLFLLLVPRSHGVAAQLAMLDGLLPLLHCTWQRVRAFEAGFAGGAPTYGGTARPGPDSGPAITDRELQILWWMRAGKSNQEIGELLGISMLTVKNHVQRILRKLGASNRAQAVALAMSSRVLGDPAGLPTPPDRGG